MKLSIDEQRDILDNALLADDVTSALWEFVESGLADEILPELPALRLEQDPIHQHKEVLSHTIAVTAKTPDDLVVRLAALFHDIGKPATRSFKHGGVTFRHHEVVGAKITKKRLRVLGYEEEIVKDVSEIVRLSGRFKGYAEGWGDAAVRRYARDAGHLLGKLNMLVRSDCTSRHDHIHQEIRHHVDDLERRIGELAEVDRRSAERPLIDGDEVMDILELGPGPEVGKAIKFLLELRRNQPSLDREGTESKLHEWWSGYQS
ncbi:MAG: HDIG domain-containing protein [Acidimicrobiales bacterium]|jgi:poly(A) polymerase|nr:HDIG domain-containing protein [Acidimicrobiales bacterium]